MPEVLFSFIECCKRCLASSFVSHTDSPISRFRSFFFSFLFTQKYFQLGGSVKEFACRRGVCWEAKRVARGALFTLVLIFGAWKDGASRLSSLHFPLSLCVPRADFARSIAIASRSIRRNRIYHISFSIYNDCAAYYRRMVPPTPAKKVPRGD